MEIHGEILPLHRMIVPEETSFQLFENKAMESSFREINLHFRWSTTEEKANYFLESGLPNLLFSGWSQNLKLASCGKGNPRNHCVAFASLTERPCDISDVKLSCN